MKNIIFAFLLLFSFTAKSQDIIGFQGFASSPIVQSGDTLKITVNVIDFSSQANGIDLGNWTDTIAIWQGCQRFPVVFKENAFGASIDLWILANPSQFSPGYCVVLGENASNIGGYVAGIDDSKNQCMLNYYLDNLSDLIDVISGVDSVTTTGDTISIHSGGQVYNVADNKLIDGVVLADFGFPAQYSIKFKDRNDLIYDTPSVNLGSFALSYDDVSNQWNFDRFNSTSVFNWDDRKTQSFVINDTLIIIQPLSSRSSEGFTGLDTITYVGGSATDTALIRSIVSDSIAAIDTNDVTGLLDFVTNNSSGGSADGVVSDMQLVGTDLTVTGSNGGFNGTVDLSSLSGGATDTALIRSIVGDSVLWSTNVDGDAYINEAVGIFNSDPFYPLQVGKNPAFSAGSSIAIIGDGANGMVIKESTASNPYSAAFFGPVKFWNGSEGGGALINANDDAGTAGQVLTSQGESSTFTWETIDTNTVVGLGPFVTNNAPSQLWTESGANVYRSSGRVAIGNANPLDTFHVTGTSRFNGYIKAEGGGSLWIQGIDAPVPVNAGNQNVLIGYGVGNVSGMSTAINNFLLGSNTGKNLTTGDNNAVIAPNGFDITTGSDNVAIGNYAMDNITGSIGSTVAIGSNAMKDYTGTLNASVAIGANALQSSNSRATGVGAQSFRYSLGADNSTGMGQLSGYSADGARCVYLGFYAGANNNTDDRLIIENSSNISTPLIDGNFAADWVKINGELIATDYTGGTPTGLLAKDATGQIVDADANLIASTRLWTESGTNVYRNSGNVGIGTATPSAKLDVVGNAEINGNATITDSLNVIGSVRVHASLYDVNNSKGSDGQIALNAEIPGSSDGFVWTDQDQALVSTHYATLYDARDTLSNVGSIYRPIRFKDAVTIEHGNSFTVDVANDEIDIDKTGWYEVEYNISFTSDTDAEFTVAVLDGSNNVICGLQQDYVYSALSFGTMSSSNIANLLDTDVLSLEIKVPSGLVDIDDINATLKIRRIR